MSRAEVQIRSTREVARLFDRPPHWLNQQITNNKCDPPRKGPGGVYLWTPDDIERASWQLFARSAPKLDSGKVPGNGQQVA